MMIAPLRLAALALCLLVAALGCADAIEQDEGVCDDTRPCAFGAICVAGYCQPPPPRLDAARVDRGGPLDRGLDADPPDVERPDARPDRSVPLDADPSDSATDLDLDPRDTDPRDGDPPDAGPLDLEPPDAARVDADLPDDCGHHGEICCPDDRCRSGACLDGICAAFGGAYAYADDGCTARNPLSRNQCTCPAGFVDHALEDVDYEARDGQSRSHSIYVCLPPRVDPAADLPAAFATAADPDGAGCPSGCRPGRAADGCGCPAGTVPHTHEGVQHRAGAACPRSVTLCAGPTPVTFGGSYRIRRLTPPCADLAPVELCLQNPTTAACSCPPGFVAQTLPMMAPHPRRPDWCEADLSLCVPAP